MLLYDFLYKNAVLYPNKNAIIQNTTQINYEQLDKMSNKFAQALIDYGIERQDRIGLYLDNSINSAIALYGILKAGCIFVIVNPQVKTKKLSYILNDCQVKILICDTSSIQGIIENPLGTPSLKMILLGNYDLNSENVSIQNYNVPGIEIKNMMDFLQHKSENPLPPRCLNIDLAALMYTSGSTGEPKGAMLTHLNMVHAVQSITTYLENSQSDIVLNYLPFSFDYGLYQLLMTIKFGGTLILEKAFIYPYQAIQKILHHKVTGFPLVPAMAALILQLKELSTYDFSHVRYITNTGQALPPTHIEELQKVFTEAKIFSMYGLTECKRVSYLPPSELKKRPLSVGKAIPGTEVWIEDANGNKITEPNTIGELVIRGAHVMKGYWNKKAETEMVLRQGIYPDEKILYSRDYFKMDEEGFLYFVSRIDDVIKSGGERISPKEIEDVLYSMEGVSEAAVIGIPDAILGNALKAFIVFREGFNIETDKIIDFCSKHLEHSRIPKHFEIRESLPKSPSGKIRKKDLESEQLVQIVSE